MWGLMIISYLCLGTTTVLLLLSGLQGYFEFNLFKASHSQFALFTAIFYMFTETLIMFYFIGSGTAIKKFINPKGIQYALYEKVKKSKMHIFPHSTINMFLIGTVFILGGAVQIGSIPGWIHGVLFDLAFFHFLYTTILQHRGFKENVEIIVELSDTNNPVTKNKPA